MNWIKRITPAVLHQFQPRLKRSRQNRLARLLTLLLLTALTTTASDWEIYRKGTNAAAFLLIGTDARSMALGGEASGLLNSVAVYWNPANGLGIVKNQLQHEVGNYLLGMDHQITSLHLALPGNQVLSFTLNNLDMGEEEITTVLSPRGTGQTYHSQAFALGVNYARLLTDHVAVGFQGKWIKEQIWLEQARNLAWDVGLRYTEPQTGFALGMTIQNMGGLSQLDPGPRTTFSRRDDDSNPGSDNPASVYKLKEFPLPLVFRMGISKVFRAPTRGLLVPVLLLNAGFSDGLTTPFNASTGIELSLIKALTLRAGYQMNRDLGNLSAGFGVNIPLKQGVRLLLDYAWIDMDYFGAVERYQLSVEF